VIYSDVVTPQTAVGYFTSIVGFGFYNYAKIKVGAVQVYELNAVDP
jgi:hypothetical protein